MGQSTDGQICFGIVFKDGYEFPWSENEDGHEEWWHTVVNGFKPSFEIYDENDEYLNGVRPSEEIITKYYKEKLEFKKNNPLPFELVNYCSGDCPMYILAVPSTFIKCSRGYPKEITPLMFNIDENSLQKFKNFCQEFDFKIEDAKWCLTSYLG